MPIRLYPELWQKENWGVTNTAAPITIVQSEGGRLDLIINTDDACPVPILHSPVERYRITRGGIFSEGADGYDYAYVGRIGDAGLTESNVGTNTKDINMKFQTSAFPSFVDLIAEALTRSWFCEQAQICSVGQALDFAHAAACAVEALLLSDGREQIDRSECWFA